MRFLIASVGSNGDIHPYIGIGAELRRRGHEVGFLVQPYFKRMAMEAGLRYFRMGDRFDLEELSRRPEMMSAWSGSVHVIRGHVIPQVAEAFMAARRAIEAFRPDVMLVHHICFGPAWAARQAAVPCAIGCLTPIMFLSRQEPVVLGPGPALPPGWRLRLNYRFAMAMSSLIYDGPMNRQRMAVGLSGGRHWLARDLKVAPLLLGLWSRCFRGPMPDDPPNGRICGFVWHDRHQEQEHAPDDIGRFLAEGDPPVIFTLGSTAVHVAGPFYQAAAEACRLLGRRGLLLTGRPEYAPRPLPPGVRAFTYAPYSAVLHRGCATVHHGGVGTTAQALRAGRPTVIVPFAHDQFDNAARVKRLGVSETVSRRRVSAASLAAALRRVLDDTRLQVLASETGSQVGEDGASAAAGYLEAMR